MSGDGSSVSSEETEFGPFTDVPSAFRAANIAMPTDQTLRVPEPFVLLHTELLRLEPSRPGPAAYRVRTMPWTNDHMGIRVLLETFLLSTLTRNLLYELAYGSVLFTVARGQIIVIPRPPNVATPVFSHVG